MKQQIPVSGSINYVFLGLQVLFLIGLTILFQLSGSDEAGIWAAMIYLVLAYGLRYTVAIDHRKGMRALKLSDYENAIVYFDRSFAFFSKHPWVDRFRVFTTFSVSKQPYREMAMVNKAFTLVCLERKEEAKALYEQCLKEYPANNIAFYALKMM